MNAQPDAELLAWLAAQGFVPRGVEALAGDVSPRRYFRVTLGGGGSAIAAAYPQDMAATCHRFAATTRLLASVGVKIPRILAVHGDGRAMLLEDLGPMTLFEMDLSWPRRLPFYRDAAHAIRAIQNLPPEPVAELNPRLDRDLLGRELEQTWEVFLLPRKLLPDTGLQRQLEAFFTDLCQRLGDAPPLPCHRDFMVRNLVPRHGGNVAVLDHQDLRLGPAHYDLASLLNDSLFPPPAVEAEILDLADLKDPEDYRRAAVQRTFKAVGTFAAFALRGFDRRLPLIPPTLNRGLGQMARLPEGADLAPRLRVALESVLTAP